MFKQILFDCGGVFVENRTVALMEKITGSRKLAEFFMERIYLDDSPWPVLYDSGQIGKEECTRRLIELIPEVEPAHIVLYMKEWPKWQFPLPTMTRMVRDVHKAGLKCYLLSNYSCQYEEFREYSKVLNGMDGEVVSYRTGFAKPDLRIFRHAAEALKLDPSETLFVDDKEENTQAAAQAGYQTYTFRDPYAFRQYLQQQGYDMKGE